MQSKKSSVASAFGVDEVLLSSPSAQGRSSDETPRVSLNVSREMQRRQAPAGGKDIASDKQSTLIVTGSVPSNAKPQRARESSVDKGFELPPVVLLKPGERFDVTPSVELDRGSRRLIFDPDELAIDERTRAKSEVEYAANAVEDNGVSAAEREDGHKSSSLAVSGSKQLQPAAGDGFDLPVILLKPGEKFPETRVLPSRPSPRVLPCTFDPDQIASDWHWGELGKDETRCKHADGGNKSSGFASSVTHGDKDKAPQVQVSEEVSAGNAFDLPPVVLLKPGEKFKEQPSLDSVHGSKRYIFDPDELPIDCYPRGGFDLPPVILLKPGETFPDTSTVPAHASVKCIFNPDEIATDWQPREADREESSIDQAEPLHLGTSAGFAMATTAPLRVEEPHKLATLSVLPTDGSTTITVPT